MTIFVKKHLLSFLFFSFFITLFSCKDEGDIGIGGSEFTNGTMVDTFTITTQIVTDPRLRTDNKFTYNGLSNPNKVKVLGFLNDNVFGKTRADVVAQFLKPDTSSFKFPPGGILDSAVFIIKYADTSDYKKSYYGERGDTGFEIQIQELTEPIRGDTAYYSDRFFQVGRTIGKGFFKENVTGNVSVWEFVPDAPDTLRKDGAQIRIPVDKNYARNKFIDAPMGVFDSQEAFDKYINGVKFRVNENSLTGKGGMIYLGMQNNIQTRLALYYHNQQDTVVKYVEITSATPQANYFWHDYTGSEVYPYITSGTKNTDKIYVQAGAGIKTKIEFPYLENIFESGKRYAINKAELVYTPKLSDKDIYWEPARLFVNHGVDRAGGFIMLPDYDINDSRPAIPNQAESGKYIEDKNNYCIQLTKYVQDVVDGKEVNPTLYLTYENPIQEGSRADGMGINKGEKDPEQDGTSLCKDCLKLRIIYSEQK